MLARNPEEKISELSEQSSDGDLEKEKRIEAIRLEVKRLSFDTPGVEIPDPNFTGETGEELTDPERKGNYIVYMMRKTANNMMEDYLGQGNFGGMTGERIPPRPSPEDSWEVASRKLESRISCHRRQIGLEVDKYQQSGVEIPTFDSKTGERIPRDSLTMLEKVKHSDETQGAVERQDTLNEVRLAFDILKMMKERRETTK